MRVEQQACWVLHRRPWRESSLLLEIFSREHGRIGLVARGARSPRSPWRGLSEPFIPLNCSWTRRSDLGTLTQLEAEGARLALQGQALWCGLYVNELVLTLFGRDDPLPELYDVYASSLPALRDSEAQASALRQIEMAMLSSLGVLPDLSHDAVRGEPILPDALYDVRPETGLVEVRSSGSGVVHGRAALFLAGQAMQAPDALTRREARLLTRRLIDHQLGGRELKTRELMRPLPRVRRQSDTDGAKE
jgi:DNA repair protein RecO (recombination protein O)